MSELQHGIQQSPAAHVSSAALLFGHCLGLLTLTRLAIGLVPHHQNGGSIKGLLKVLSQGVEVIVGLIQTFIAAPECGAPIRRGVAVHNGGHGLPLVGCCAPARGWRPVLVHIQVVALMAGTGIATAGLALQPPLCHGAVQQTTGRGARPGAQRPSRALKQLDCNVVEALTGMVNTCRSSDVCQIKSLRHSFCLHSLGPSSRDPSLPCHGQQQCLPQPGPHAVVPPEAAPA